MNRNIINIITIIIIGALASLWASSDVQIAQISNVIIEAKPSTQNIISTSDFLSIPLILNYQGKLTDVSGNPVRDSTYSITFRFFRVPSSGSALWTETQNVQTTNGLFNVLLGSSNAIDSIPQDGNCYLEMQVNPNSPMTPRVRLVSSAYSYLSRKADSANYAASAQISRPITPGVGTTEIANLAVTNGKIADNAVTTTRIMDANVTLPKISPAGSSAGQAIISTGSSTSPTWGNVSPGPHNHLGESWTSTMLDQGLKMKLNVDTSVSIYCHIDTALNAGSGLAAGALMYAGGAGTGSRYGALSYGYCPTGSNNPAVGIYGRGTNQGNGDAYGGSFNAQGAGSGTRFGIYAYSTGDDKVWGVRGQAVPTATSADTGAGVVGICNSSGSGRAMGGLFQVEGSGTGAKYGAVGKVEAGSNVTAASMGVSGTCDHAGTGNAIGGGFVASGDGTGNKVGVSGSATAPAGSSNSATGVIGIGWHNGAGDAYGGQFSTLVAGTGKGYGVRATGNGSDDSVYGVYGVGSSSGSGPAFGVYGKSDEGRGGYFRNANNNYYALTAWNNTGTGSTVRGLYVQGHGYATGGWQTFLDDGGTGFSLISPKMEIVTSGTGSLINGKSDITFDQEFSHSVSEAVALKVIITPTSECNGVFVSKKSSSGFSVNELMGGKANATFDWIAIAHLRDFDQRTDNDPVQSGNRR